jgi:hypothetical protein
MSVSVLPSQIIEGNDAVFTISSSVVATTPITVSYRMAGKAQQGIDYTLDGMSGRVVIPSGQASARVILHSIADEAKEWNEGAGLHLMSGLGYFAPKSAWARVVILGSR